MGGRQPKLSLIRNATKGKTGAGTVLPVPLTVLESRGSIVNSSDPTDHALAAIASMLRQNLEAAEVPPPEREAERQALAVVDDEPLAPETPNGDDYFKVGPGPIVSIRFKWSMRRGDNDEFFVDETIGETSTPIVAGPMSREAAVKLIDDREAEARRRFEDLRNEMAGRSAVAHVLRASGEA